MGIVNITTDSFSDGGRYLDRQRAISHAAQLIEDGAAMIELGAASSHPDASPVSPADEVARLEPVTSWAQRSGVPVSIDSFAPEVQRWAIGAGVAAVNDVAGFADPTTWPELAAGTSTLVVMHSLRSRGRATREASDAGSITDRAIGFLRRRCADLEAAGVRADRLVVDPGLGFFVGDTPEASLEVLRSLARIRVEVGRPLLISASRKSFLRDTARCSLAEVGPASLAAELWASRQGADLIRTHEVKALATALRIEGSLAMEPNASALG